MYSISVPSGHGRAKSRLGKAASYDACEDFGVVVPEFESPLCSDGLRALEHLLNSTGPNIPVKELYLLCREFVSSNMV